MLEAKNKSTFPEDDGSKVYLCLNGSLSNSTYILPENSNTAVKVPRAVVSLRCLISWVSKS